MGMARRDGGPAYLPMEAVAAARALMQPPSDGGTVRAFTLRVNLEEGTDRPLGLLAYENNFLYSVGEPFYEYFDDKDREYRYTVITFVRWR